MTAPHVEVEGLRELGRSLRKLSADAPKALRLALNDAADVILDDAKPRVPRRSGRARGTLKAQSTRTESRVSGGGGRAPYYPWLDFGGRVGRRKRTLRPVLKDGRYIYNAFFRRRDDYRDALDDRLADVIASAGLEAS